ncbi:nucleoporin NDC1-like [Gigantopelta aegis]|uniref:nucleoporin NDC1-like n=1 Tax=Gigantopelta aegis TaxID=1735272 RepID=UPI001B887597|nr:nucleoporin NDC1-like [Gigantopelta aegis]
MLPIEIWFLGEVCRWRHVASIIWFILLLPPVSFVYLFLAQIYLFHPWTWISNFLYMWFSLWFLIGVNFIVFVHSAHMWFSFSSFTVVPVIYNTRCERFLSLFRMSRLPYLVSYVALGIIMAWSAASFFIGERFAGLTYKLTTSSDAVYLNESHLFLILYGVYLGVVAYGDFILHTNYLEFPVVQRKKIERIKLEIVPLLNRCAKQTLQKLKYFYILYFFFGAIPRRWVCTSINRTIHPEIRPLDSILGLFDMELLWQTLTFGMFANVCWSLGTLLVKVHHTEHYAFQIVHILQASRDKCLSDALSSRSIPLLQYLGYQDVSHLSQFSPIRRKEVFSLSQPGGHPHIWNKLCSACLSSIDELISHVHRANWQAVTALPLKKPVAAKNSNFNHTANISGSFLNQTGPNLSMSVEHSLNTTNPPVVQQAKPVWKRKISLIIKENSLLHYFFNELPNAKSHSLFASAQPSIWSIEALSFLVAASYSEDQYGVVQQTLPNILTSLLTLHENVEKYSKLTSSVCHPSHKDQLTSGMGSLRYRLQITLKTSIHRIVDSFGKHLLNVHLSPECAKMLKPFMEMRHGVHSLE